MSRANCRFRGRPDLGNAARAVQARPAMHVERDGISWKRHDQETIGSS
jgi:hypothetical protein